MNIKTKLTLSRTAIDQSISNFYSGPIIYYDGMLAQWPKVR